jgi:hypothetical protein
VVACVIVSFQEVEMKKRFEDKLTSFKGLQGFFEQNPGLLVDRPALSRQVTQFNAHVDQIVRADKIAQTSAVGKSEDKSSTSKQLIVTTINVKSALKSFADETKNEEILALVALPDSKLNRLRDTALVTQSTIYYECASLHIAALAEHSLKPAMLEKLKTLINSYNLKIQNKETGTAEKKSANKALPELFKNTDLLLKNQIDEQMKMIQEQDGELYSQYRILRKIIHSGVRHRPTKDTKTPPATKS